MNKIIISNKQKLFTVAGLADCIERDKQTVKLWIKQGMLPTAPFMTRHGKNEVRLYPMSYVEAIKQAMWDLKLRRGAVVDKIMFKAYVKKMINQKEREGV